MADKYREVKYILGASYNKKMTGEKKTLLFANGKKAVEDFVTREREIKAMQLLFRQRLLPLDLIEEFAAKVPIAEEQPVSTARSRRHAMLEEGPERRDPGAGANHDDVSIAVYG